MKDITTEPLSVTERLGHTILQMYNDFFIAEPSKSKTLHGLVMQDNGIYVVFNEDNTPLEIEITMVEMSPDRYTVLLRGYDILGIRYPIVFDNPPDALSTVYREYLSIKGGVPPILPTNAADVYGKVDHIKSFQP